jgi:hypothetical protein
VCKMGQTKLRTCRTFLRFRTGVDSDASETRSLANSERQQTRKWKHFARVQRLSDSRVPKSSSVVKVLLGNGRCCLARKQEISYNGVATLSRHPIETVSTSLGGDAKPSEMLPGNFLLAEPALRLTWPAIPRYRTETGSRTSACRTRIGCCPAVTETAPTQRWHHGRRWRHLRFVA